MIPRLIMVLAGVALLSSMGSSETPSWVGRIAVKGNEPFTFVALTDSQGREWRLEGQDVRVLRTEGQGRWVRITGQLQDRTIVVDTWAWVPDQGASE